MLLVNGAVTRSIDALDRGLHYGDGVFTTLPVRRGVPLFLEEHLDRLSRDAAQLYLPCPDRELLQLEARRLAESQPDAVLKILLTRGTGGRGYQCPDPAVPTRVLALYPLPDYPASCSAEGVRVGVCATRLGHNPALAGVKHLNRLEQVLARREWSGSEVREALMCDQDGFVVEGVMSNLFLVQSGKLLTPLLDRCGVRGVMRARVMRVAAEFGQGVVEGRIGLDQVRAADEVFLTNSLIGIWPVAEFDGRRYPPGPHSRALMEALGRLGAQYEAAACRA
ncbi:MAG: aminodeoxychorismate lyase [Methylococcaceae bacterium]|nr:aminodeoxychorismate lyase [Methylococcaceae bacterium]